MLVGMAAPHSGGDEQQLGAPSLNDDGMLAPMPTLLPPTVTVRDSYLEGERAMCLDEGEPADHLDLAAADFDASCRADDRFGNSGMCRPRSSGTSMDPSTSAPS
jgi:hypothetical protein